MANNALGFKTNGTGCTYNTTVGPQCNNQAATIDVGANATFTEDANKKGTVAVTGSTQGLTGPSGVANVSTVTDVDGTIFKTYSANNGNQTIYKKSAPNDDFFLILSADTAPVSATGTSIGSLVVAHGGKTTTADLTNKSATFVGKNAGNVYISTYNADGSNPVSGRIVGDVNMALNNNQVSGTITSANASGTTYGNTVSMSGATLNGKAFSGGNVTLKDTSANSMATFANSAYSGGFYGTTGTEPNYVAGVAAAQGDLTTASGAGGKKLLLFGNFWGKNTKVP